MEKVISGAVCGTILLLTSMPSFAALPVRNHNPLAQFVGIPAMADAQKLSVGQMQFQFDATLSSHFIVNETRSEQLVLDGESYVGDFRFRYGFKSLELEVTLPWLSYQRGFMDGIIQDFHKAFGMPNGDRHKFRDYQFELNYQGIDSHALMQPEQGLGDIRVSLGFQLQQTVDYQHALHTQIKLPTGDSDKWLGSGSTDVAVYTTHRWQRNAWRIEGQIGALWMDKADILPNQRESVAGFLGLSVGYELWQNLYAILQWDAHSALYGDSSLTPLGDAHMLTGGLEYQHGNWQYQLAVIEDIKVDSAPDVGFMFSLAYRAF